MQKRRSSRLHKAQKPLDGNSLPPSSRSTSASPNGLANGTHLPDVMQKTSHPASWVRYRWLTVAAAVFLILAAGSSALWYPWLRNAPGRPASSPGVLNHLASTLPADSPGRSSVQDKFQRQQASSSLPTGDSYERQAVSCDQNQQCTGHDQNQQCTGQDETCSEGHPERCVGMAVFGRCCFHCTMESAHLQC